MDLGSLVIAVITCGLFVTALFFKGWTHDLFLEVGVFLVSVKIMLLAYHNGVAVGDLDEKLDTVLTELKQAGEENRSAATGAPQRSDPRT